MKQWTTVPLVGLGLVLLALAFFLHVYAGMACGLVLVITGLFFRLSMKKDDGSEG